MQKMLHPICNSNADNGSSKSLRKRPWNAEEDAVLVGYVEEHGEGNWNAVQEVTGLARCGKSCRLRWANHLRPNLKKGPLTPEEEMLIVVLHGQFGNKWALMASLLPGRTDNEIKNYWNTRMKRQKRRAPLMASTFEYEYGNTWNYDFSEMGLLASMKMELPSNQLFNGNGGDGESAFGMLMDPRNGDGHDFFEESRRFNGNINVEEEMSKLFDLVPTPSMPALPELYTTSDSRGISNGWQSSSSVAAEVDERGLGLQNLTSPLTAAPADQEMERRFVPTERRAWGSVRACVDLH